MSPLLILVKSGIEMEPPAHESVETRRAPNARIKPCQNSGFERPYIVPCMLARRVSLNHGNPQNHGNQHNHGNPQGGTDADTTSLANLDRGLRRHSLPGDATA